MKQKPGTNISSLRLAAIDMGTHSARCLVAEAQPDGNYRLLDDIRAPTSLGKDLALSKNISPAARQRLMAALRHIMDTLNGLNVSTVSLTATSALRTARNGGEVAAEIKRTLGVDVEIISGNEEALVVFESAAYSLDLGTGRFAVADIGGGSTEISVGTASAGAEQIVSLDIGAVYLTDRLVRSNPVCKRQWNAIAKTVRAKLAKNLDKDSVQTPLIVGTGGTLTTLAAVHMALQSSRSDQLHGYVMPAADVEHTAMFLAGKTIAELRDTKGIPYDRAEIVPAGACAAVEIIRFLGAKRMVICDRGLREGLFLRLIRKTFR